jgi:hypothetical protein
MKQNLFFSFSFCFFGMPCSEQSLLFFDAHVLRRVLQDKPMARADGLLRDGWLVRYV